ncbi:PAS domain-containing protein [Serratia sp. NPDC078593]|uniref:PAS domain-containing protein n=1 Tax=unclassified Serratia (in: enterobacteria) TaxID=2647522 RepID=UPI0037D8C102
MPNINLEDLYHQVKNLAISIPMEMLVSWEMSSEAWCVKNCQGNIIYINKGYKNIARRHESSGVTWKSSFCQQIALHDSMVMKTEMSITAIGIFPPNERKETMPFLCERSPLFNRNAEVQGVISHVQPVLAITTAFFFRAAL